MSAPRISQFLPLRQLASTARHTTRQRRALHMTGPKDYAPVLNSAVLSSEAPISFASLRTESQRKTNLSELIPRGFATTATSGAVPSTHIDYTYLPDLSSPDLSTLHVQRVPIIPDLTNASIAAHVDEPDLLHMRRQVETVAMDSVVFPLTETHDGAVPALDHSEFTVGQALLPRAVAEGVDDAKAAGVKQGGVVGKILRGLVDDVFGPAKSAVGQSS